MSIQCRELVSCLILNKAIGPSNSVLFLLTSPGLLRVCSQELSGYRAHVNH